MITAVVFDIGETLLDDTREWAAWADWLGVPRHTFSAVVGAVVASGRDNRESFAYFFRDDFDLERERAARIAAGAGQVIEESDLYADVRPALSVLRRARVWVGIAGNQTAAVGDRLRTLDLPADAIATSADWGVGKPDPGFFDRVASMSPAGRSGLLYVGRPPRPRLGCRASCRRTHRVGPARAMGPSMARRSCRACYGRVRRRRPGRPRRCRPRHASERPGTSRRELLPGQHRDGIVVGNVSTRQDPPRAVATTMASPGTRVTRPVEGGALVGCVDVAAGPADRVQN